MLRGEHPGLNEQQRWMNDDLRVPELYHYLLRTRRGHALVVRPVPVLDHVRVRADQSRAHDPATLPARRTAGGDRDCSAAVLGAAGLWFNSAPSRRWPAPVHAAGPPAGRGRAASRSPRPTTPTVSGPVQGNDRAVRPLRGRREGGKGWKAARMASSEVAVGDLPISLVTSASVRSTRRGPRGSCRRPRLHPDRRPQRRLRRRRGLRAAVGARELLAHDHGSVARRDASSSPTAPARSSVALRTSRRRASRSPTRRSTRSACAFAADRARSGTGRSHSTSRERVRARELPMGHRARRGRARVSNEWLPMLMVALTGTPRGSGTVRILMVSPYPPIRGCGSRAYTVREVAALLRTPGHDVEVLSPWPSAAHHHSRSAGGWKGRACTRWRSVCISTTG